ncbi:MAG: NAD(+) kinase [Opitutae bacterium]|nr:NAD(+) kinase [Opitutae bacterium]
MEPLSRIAIVANASKVGAVEAASALEAIAQAEGVEVSSTAEFPPSQGFLEGMDACFVVGGDGTLLGMLDEAVRLNVPVAGVKHGQLGFLATFSPEDLLHQLPPIFRGDYQVRRRSLLRCQFGLGDSRLALNDIVVKSGSDSRLARLAVRVEDEPVAEYACDGIIFSTPTGSTAYNLAAGGPLVHPAAHVVVMTPISAHTLTSRSVVFPRETRLFVESVGEQDPPTLAADGQDAYAGANPLPLEVVVPEETFPLLEEKNHSHFRVLRNKLKWD